MFANAAYEKNFMLGDEMKVWDDKIIVLYGMNYASTGAVSFNSNGTESSPNADAAALTPTASLTYKILPWLSSYVSFQQSLSAGGFVPTSSGGLPYTNAGALIPPFLGTEWEGGIKATVGNNLLLTMAIFDLTQPALFTINNGNGTLTESTSGSEHVQGIEFKVMGKVWDDLTLYGGASLDNPRLQATKTQPFLQGQLVPYFSPVSATLYSEYTVPIFAEIPWLHNLTLTAGLRYTGPYKFSSYSSLNSAAGLAAYKYSSTQGYLVGDLGFRYVYDLDGHPTTFRFTVTNVTNQAYWQAGNVQNVGPGRVFAASTEFKW